MANSDYLPTIGLEIHAELNTNTKMFCSSKNDASEKRPNSNVCPVCTAHPGTLPVINKAAVEHVLRVGVALGSKLADYTEFDRKNYFYPDLPKGYQLSQFEHPLVSGGQLNGVRLTRIHLEEDTASSVHDENSDATLVDYNRAGVPLMELVTEPVLHSAEECGNFGRELQLLLRYLGASEADMEKGQMRLEANISVAKISAEDAAKEKNSAAGTSIAEQSSDRAEVDRDKKSIAATASARGDGGVVLSAGDYALANDLESAPESKESKPTNSTQGPTLRTGAGSDLAEIDAVSLSVNADAPIDLSKLGTKVEVKNINSFRAMERAIDFEVKRQIALLERGEKVVQETRGWDENKQATFSQRKKEGSADYRYFPDPDLPSLKLSELGLTKDAIALTLPELPWQKRARLGAMGINTQDVELYVKDALFGAFFEAVRNELGNSSTESKLASNYIANDLVKLITDLRDVDTRDMKNLDKMPISASNFAKLVRLTATKKVSSRAAKDILALCMDGVSDPESVARERNLLQESSGAQIGPIVAKVISDNPLVVADFKAGKDAALEYLVGQGMKASRGAADPVTLRAEISSQLR